MQALDFSDQTVLITGASRGIGYGVAQLFAECGADVHIMARGQDTLEAASTLSDKTNRQVTGWVCDITNSQSVDSVFSQLPKLDTFVANAGLELVTPITDTTSEAEARFRRVIDVNVIGTYLSTRAAVPLIKGGGNIIITSSIWGTTAEAELGAYIASKHANLGFMRVLAKELGPRDIRVNAVCPGWVLTDPARETLRQMAQERDVSEDVVASEISSQQSLPGIQSPADMALSYLYLASSLAKNITGQKINADRGAVQG
ncbi:SDR family oxidoreductase [uncultured Ruegeria sp.]|uniref:SDR family NAD(P)-dependent oxidoreductase n=1 Tax=uncultured Ruegeria sp. TaxID=259304 RepID=UPI002618FECE|nr:SDR family oxidoreductase [uncultured Ruegeria sp.]